MLYWSGGDTIKDVVINLIGCIFNKILHKEKQHPSIKIDVIFHGIININIHKD